ncbi:MAG: protoglobin domain-containing protein [Ignavibacteria bacterium]|nr:protoglobin domain-containing protein [Ignavibacteria bacterium]
MSQQEIKGYDYGKVDKSPVSMDDFRLLQATVLFTDDDKKYLKMAGEVLESQIDDILDLWYGFVGGNKHLVYYFTDGKGSANADYLAAVRARFGQWIKDLCFRDYDQDWLNYQHEIALRHHSTKKNKTDNVQSVDIIPLRYMIAFIYPITATIKSFLAKKGHSSEDVEKMHDAWFKAVTLSVVLWSYPYAQEGNF